jgi:hypothetical protein
MTQLVEPIHPQWSYLHQDVNTPYHWMAEQSEWATDYVFNDPAELARLYPRWIRHGLETLQCQDILRYFNKNVPNRCSPDDVKAHFADRDHGPYAGTRLKFWHKTNSIKFYDKQSIALRIETTINQPKEFRVFRHTERQDKTDPKDWHEMRKSVADMPRRAEVAQTAYNRLAESLASPWENSSNPSANPSSPTANDAPAPSILSPAPTDNSSACSPTATSSSTASATATSASPSTATPKTPTSAANNPPPSPANSRCSALTNSSSKSRKHTATA